jgi:hypothetical protein
MADLHFGILDRSLAYTNTVPTLPLNHILISPFSPEEESPVA